MLRFAAIGIDHGHIFDHVKGLMRAGAEFVGYCPQTSIPGLMDTFAQTYPDTPQIDRETLLADESIDIICTAAIPRDRAGIAIAAMRAGKDVMSDKPGVTTFDQLDDIRKAVLETGKIFSICFSERHCVRSAVKAGKLIADGAIGTVIQTIGTGPHRLGQSRPDWFWKRDAFGGIIVDIASHQIDQFLFYTGSTKGEIVTSQVGNFANPQAPEFEDFGDLVLRGDRGTGYVRVDWFTPDGLPTWGDGRLTIMGTKGYIELRKYIDIAGREGKDHLFLVNEKGVEHIDCSSEELDYFRQFSADVRERTETAMSQDHVYEVCRLSLEAQTRATNISPKA
ncbi:MAG: oxidoreductase [Pelagibacterium sp.]|jgi:predicted dehydrogenase|nr:oxidoreductase [Pelagibacterium sp.]|tara:strand:+ start:6947 stop:7957 length:1011 start_codon:yes stop_codon:yes gene_type:complete